MYKICDCHLELIKPYSWGKYGPGYIAATVNGKQVAMHRFIMGSPAGKEVDHINGDKTDNRCSNLRVCSRAQNQANAVKKFGNYKGVGFYKKQWRARLMIDYQEVHIGLFDEEGEAAAAYDSVALQIFGNFARTNY
jgi:hypothetical protein